MAALVLPEAMSAVAMNTMVNTTTTMVVNAPSR